MVCGIKIKVHVALPACLLPQVAACVFPSELQTVPMPALRSGQPDVVGAASYIFIEANAWTTCQGNLVSSRSGNQKSANLICDDGDAGTVKIQDTPRLGPASDYFIRHGDHHGLVHLFKVDEAIVVGNPAAVRRRKLPMMGLSAKPDFE